MDPTTSQPINVELFGETLPLKLQHSHILRAEFALKIKMLGPQAADFWNAENFGLFQVGVLLYAATLHLKRNWTIDDILNEIVNSNSEKVPQAAMEIFQEYVKPYITAPDAGEGSSDENPTTATATTG